MVDCDFDGSFCCSFFMLAVIFRMVLLFSSPLPVFVIMVS
jgi:hypothetical protein